MIAVVVYRGESVQWSIKKPYLYAQAVTEIYLASLIMLTLVMMGY